MTSSPKPNALVWLLLSVVVIGLDQWSKHWVLTSLPEYQPVVVIEGASKWVEMELGRNIRAAVSITSDMGRGPLSNEQAQASLSWRL